MNALIGSTVFDHIAHGLFDLVIPVLLGLVMRWGNTKWGAMVLERVIKHGAGIGYTELLRGGLANIQAPAAINDAINDGVNYVMAHAKDVGAADRKDIAARVRGELGAMLSRGETP